MSHTTSSFAVFSRRINEQGYRYLWKRLLILQRNSSQHLKPDKLGKSLHFYQFTLSFPKDPFGIKNKAALMVRGSQRF